MNIVLGQNIVKTVKSQTISNTGIVTSLGTVPIGAYTLYGTPQSGTGNAVSQFSICNTGTANVVNATLQVGGTNGNLSANINAGNLNVFTDNSGDGDVVYDFVITGVFR